jgi:glycosyltransferase involved in cell wall biosynthesis
MLSPRIERSRPGVTPKWLILEPVEDGHTFEWLRHLIEFIDASDLELELLLLVPASLQQDLARMSSGRRVRVFALSRAEHAFCVAHSLVVAAFARWWTMRRHLLRHGAQRGFFLSLDLLALPLALGLGAGQARISGILFRPSVHYGDIGPYRPKLRERARDVRKNVFYRLMLRNPAVDRILSLDPFFAAHARTRYRHGTKVAALPDPAHPLVEATAAGSETDFVPQGRTGFLLFGHLAERKGPLAILDALALLEPGITEQLAILFAGKVDRRLRDRLKGRSRALLARRPGLWLRIDDRRIEEAELASLVRRSDVVLAPYQRFVGSSGVLMWAAQYGRPVLTQDYGLIGRLTREHRLGACTDTSDPARLAAQMAQMVKMGPQGFIDRAAARRFVAEQTPRRFASLVLSA